MTSHWIILILAGLFEIVWAVGLKYTEGFTKLLPTLVTITFMIASVYLLAIAMEKIPVGTAYTVWTGIGIFGATLLGCVDICKN